jgi:hypothetical protein
VEYAELNCPRTPINPTLKHQCLVLWNDKGNKKMNAIYAMLQAPPDANDSMEGEQDHTREVIRKIEEMQARKSHNKK